MRAKRTIRVPTAAKLAVGASVLAFPATAVAFTSDGTSPASATQQSALNHAALKGPHAMKAEYGHKTFVHGTAPSADAGAAVALEYEPTNATHWRTVDRARVRRNGHYKLSARLGRSGHLQVVPVAATPANTALSSNQASSGPAAGAPTLNPSTVAPVIVRPKLTLAKKVGTALEGKSAHIAGKLLPAVAGRKVVLEVRRGHRWVAVGHGRTGRHGGFDVHYTPAAAGSQVVHVAFAGDRLNSHADSGTESISPMQYAEVSWYDDAGNTACGFHATYGIASRTLPCGSKVTLSYGGRTVVATVDDRGPFVYSRLYDLNQNTAGALGMGGVATVLASA